MTVYGFSTNFFSFLLFSLFLFSCFEYNFGVGLFGWVGAFSCLLVLYPAEWAVVAEPEPEPGGLVRMRGW